MRIWWFGLVPHLQITIFIGFCLNRWLQFKSWSTCLSRKTPTNFGTNTLDISPRMLFAKLLSESLVYQLSLLLLILPLAKAVPWGRCMIVPTLFQENEPSVLLDWFIWISLVPCPLNHILVLVMFLLSLMTIWDMHLLPSYTAKTQLHSIFRLWYSGLKPLLVTRSPLYVQTKGAIYGWGTTIVLPFQRCHSPDICSSYTPTKWLCKEVQ